MTSLLTDEMLRQLIAVGQADLVVGIPTLNHADAVGDVVDAVTRCFRTHFPQARGVIVNVDGGSDDGTPERVLDPARRAPDGAGGLRTIHRVSARYPGLLSRAKEIQVVLAANELVGARALAIIDPDCAVSADSVAGLLRPVLEEPCDFVTPVYSRAWCEGLLVTQLVRPALRGVYRRAPAEPVTGEWACSSRFASDRLAGPLWDTDLGTSGVSLWLATEAIASGDRLRQVGLGLRPAPLRPVRAGLPDIFAPIVSGLFRCVGLHEAHWRAAAEAGEVPTVGAAAPAPEAGERPDAEPLARSFRSGMRDLEPVLRGVLRPATWQSLREVADASEGAPRFTDDLWATVVYEFAAAFHHGPMHRDHLTQTLITPYLGRTASFLAAHTSAPAAAAAAAVDSLHLAFERAKPHLMECWNPGGTP